MNNKPYWTDTSNFAPPPPPVPGAPLPPVPGSPPPPPVPGTIASGRPDMSNQNLHKYKNGLSDKLNALIESAVCNGDISDIERAVLIRNAQAENVPMDEFVVILEARLYERRLELKSMQTQSPSLSVGTPPPPPMNVSNVRHMGVLRKCPACNAVINKARAISCPQCGYEFTNI
ncbi:MAG: hypothetical protein NC217_08490 [Muribaculaceae bacterium]|nr:hypothetical protein [Muribaculaceae bacterium]